MWPGSHAYGTRSRSEAVERRCSACHWLFAQGTRSHLDGTLRGANQSLKSGIRSLKSEVCSPQAAVCRLQSTFDTLRILEWNAVPRPQLRIHSKPSTSIHEPGAQRSRDLPSHAHKLLILFDQTLSDRMTRFRFSLARSSVNPTARNDSPLP